MKEEWLERYRTAQKKDRELKDALVGFNANLDRTVRAEDFELDVEPQHHETVDNMRKLREELEYARANSINEEVQLDFEPEIEAGELSIGGQAGIISNYLSKHGHGVIFYTPLLSGDLIQRLNEKILYPVMDGELVLKNVKDSKNTDRTKENLIVEYDDEKTGRVIFSQKLRGFGPYFRKGVEDNLDKLQKGFDRAIVSGFHNSEGNVESKLKKSAEQLSKIDKPVHLEFVHREKTDEAVLDYVAEKVNSIGLDENEAIHLGDLLGYETEQLSLGDAYQISKKIINRFSVDRVATHTYGYHLTVVKESYEVSPEKIRDGMLYGELCAIAVADTDDLGAPIEQLDFNDLDLHGLEELEDFQESLELERFTGTGLAEIGEYRAVAIPTLIHENPKRLVGLGDVISAGAFMGEIS